MRRLWTALVISAALGGLSMWLVTPDVFDRELVRALSRVTPGAMIAAAVPVVAWWLLNGLRITFLARCLGARVTLWEGVQTHIVGVFSAAVTPAGGGNTVGIAWLLTRFGLSARDAVAVAVMYLVGDLAFFAWSVPVAYAALRSNRVRLPIEDVGLLVVVVSLLTLAMSYLLVFRLDMAAGFLRRVFRLPLLRRFQHRTDNFLAELGVASESFSAQPWHWHLRFHLLSGTARLSYFLVLNMLLMAVGADILHLAAYAAQIMVHAFAFIIPTPGASGYQEAAMTYALRGSAARGTIAAAVILWRLYHHYSYFVVGPLVGGAALATSGSAAGATTIEANEGGRGE